MTATLSAASTILIVEDDPGIAELERERLEDAGYDARIAHTADEALQAVREGGIDLVLLDYRLPGEIDGLEFYARVKAAGFDIPVILVTGFGNEATVIQALRIGVRDFVTKSLEYLDYLPEAVARVLRQVGTERRLAESEARLAGIIESAKDAVIVIESNRTISLFNPAAERMFACPAEKAYGLPITDFIPDDFVTSSGEMSESSMSHRLRTGTVGIRWGGERFPLEASVSRGQSNGQQFHTLVVRDTTERKRSEHALRLFRALIDHATDSIVVIDIKSARFLDVNETACLAHGYTRSEYMKKTYHEIDPTVAARPWHELIRDWRRAASPMFESMHQRKDGSTFPVEVSLNFVPLDREYLVAVVRDITKRKRAEEALRRSEALLKRAEAMAHVAGWTYELTNGVYISSEEGARICGLEHRPHTADELVATIHPDDRLRVQTTLNHASAGQSFEIEYRLGVNGAVKWVSVRGEPEGKHRKSWWEMCSLRCTLE